MTNNNENIQLTHEECLQLGENPSMLLKSEISDAQYIERLIEAGNRLVAWIQQNGPDAGKNARADWFKAVEAITSTQGWEGGE